MTKRDIIEAVAQQALRCSRRDAERLVNAVFASMTAALAAGDRIELRGFGSFTVKQRAARVSRNPRTGTRLTVAAKNIPVFKVSKALRARVGGTWQAARTRAPANDQRNEGEEWDKNAKAAGNA